MNNYQYFSDISSLIYRKPAFPIYEKKIMYRKWSFAIHDTMFIYRKSTFPIHEKTSSIGNNFAVEFIQISIKGVFYRNKRITI